MDDKMLEIGNRLSKEREKAGYSQEALAEGIGVCAVTVSRWENGHTQIKAIDIINVTTKLNISVDYLLGIQKSEIKLEDMIADLNLNNRNLIIAILKTMVENFKN